MKTLILSFLFITSTFACENQNLLDKTVYFKLSKTNVIQGVIVGFNESSDEVVIKSNNPNKLYTVPVEKVYLGK